MKSFHKNDRGFPEQALRDIYKQFEGDENKVLDEACARFNWTIGEAFVATTFLYSPKENLS